MHSFSGMPRLETPTSVENPDRVFQLRIYESPSTGTNATKALKLQSGLSVGATKSGYPKSENRGGRITFVPPAGVRGCETKTRNTLRGRVTHVCDIQGSVDPCTRIQKVKEHNGFCKL